MSFVEKLVSKRGEQIHKVSAIEADTGMVAFYFVMLYPSMENKFLQEIKDKKNLDLEDYGKIIASCYGTEPNQKVKNFLKDKYDFDVD